MHEILVKIADELDAISTWLKANDQGAGNPPNIQHGNWHHIAVPYTELAFYSAEISERIRSLGVSNVGDRLNALTQVHRGLNHFRTQGLQHLWGHPQIAPAIYFSVLDSVERSVLHSLQGPKETSVALKGVSSRIRAIDSVLKKDEARATSISEFIDRIEKAHEAAEQLPTDLDQLEETRNSVKSLAADSADKHKNIERLSAEASDIVSALKVIKGEATDILAKSGSAYAAATSRGLAAAFTQRSKSLSWSTVGWVVGLIAALGIAGIIGSDRLSALAHLLSAPSIHTELVYVNLVAAVLSIGAPVWFAWLATKQIGQTFRLSEDYAFKAAISQAYEGYRKEANRLGGDLEAKLLGSALQRLDEQPLRLVEQTSYGSPWHELMASSELKSAVTSIPGMPQKILELVRGTSKAAPDPKT